jgi:hypothetical protein
MAGGDAAAHAAAARHTYAAAYMPRVGQPGTMILTLPYAPTVPSGADMMTVEHNLASAMPAACLVFSDGTTTDDGVPLGTEVPSPIVVGVSIEGTPLSKTQWDNTVRRHAVAISGSVNLACVINDGGSAIMPPLLSTLYVDTTSSSAFTAGTYRFPRFTTAVGGANIKRVGVVTAVNGDFASNGYAEVTVILTGPQP